MLFLFTPTFCEVLSGKSCNGPGTLRTVLPLLDTLQDMNLQASESDNVYYLLEPVWWHFLLLLILYQCATERGSDTIITSVVLHLIS